MRVGRCQAVSIIYYYRGVEHDRIIFFESASAYRLSRILAKLPEIGTENASNEHRKSV
nr:hypothetical protein [Bacillus sp. UMB0893]